MIIENALFSISPEQAPDFEAAVAEAVPFFKASAGCRAMALERVIENPGQYRLIVRWDTVEHHTQLFRNSPNFQSWRGLVAHFFTSPPEVSHSSPVAQYFCEL